MSLTRAANIEIIDPASGTVIVTIPTTTTGIRIRVEGMGCDPEDE